MSIKEKQGSKSNKKPLSLKTKIGRVFLVSILILVSLIIGTTAVLYIQKDQITEELLLTMNDRLNGELKFDDVSFNPLVEFPKMSIDLIGTRLYLSSATENTEKEPTISIQTIRAAVDIYSIFSEQLDISEIILQDGEIELIRYQDSTYNLNNLIIAKSDTLKSQNKSDSTTNVLNLQLNLEELRLSRITLLSNDQIHQNHSRLMLEDLSLAFTNDSSSIYGSMDAAIMIDSLAMAGIDRIDDAFLTLNTSLSFSKKTNVLEIKSSQISSLNSKFEFEGILDFREQGIIDLRFRAEDPVFAISSYLLDNLEYDNLNTGSVHLDGHIFTNSFVKMPQIDVDFGLEGLKMDFPSVNGALNDLTVKGNFNSGTKADLSEASLAIDTLYGEFKNGFVHGAGFLDDFLEPTFDLFFESELNLESSAPFHEIRGLENISGFLESRVMIIGGQFGLDNNEFSFDFLEADLDFDSVALFIPGQIDLAYLSGAVHHFDGTENINKILSEDQKINDYMIVTSTLGSYSATDSVCSAKLNATLNLYGSKNIDLEPISSLLNEFSGHVSATIATQNLQYSPSLSYLQYQSILSELKFSDLSFSIPNLFNVNNLNGEAQTDQDLVRLNNVRFKTDSSDFVINGDLHNLKSLILAPDTTISAELKITSEQFNYRNFLSFEPVAATAFPFKMRNISLDVEIKTSSTDIKDLGRNGDMFFDINNLSVEVEELFPPVQLSNGQFNLEFVNGRPRLSFEQFIINSESGLVEADVHFDSPEPRQNNLDVDLNFKGFNPSPFLGLHIDSIGSFMEGRFFGDLSADLQFPMHANELMHKVNLSANHLSYNLKDDSLAVQGLKLSSSPILTPNGNFDELQHSKANLTIEFDRFQYDTLSWNGPSESVIDVNAGLIEITPTLSALFGKELSGKFSLEPWSEPPKYKAKLFVQDYRLEDLVKNFVDEPLINGLMDYDIELILEMQGDQFSWKGLNGNVDLRGEEMTLFGVDLDQIIQKFERSQRFSLVDVGAVVFLGPAGLAVSKGSDYASLLMSNKEETTRILEMRSKKTIRNGVIFLEDVAFSTEQYRVAARGSIDMPNDSINLSIAVIDRNGCSIIEQNLSGSFSDLNRSKINFLETVLAPITGLIDKVDGQKCTPFYLGTIQHPNKKRFKEERRQGG